MSPPTSFPPDPPRDAFPCTARDLVAVLYRQAGLIAICALAPVALQSLFGHGLPLGAPHDRRPGETTPWQKAGQLAQAGDALRQPADRIAALPVPHAGADGGLKLDLSPDLPIATSRSTTIGTVFEASTLALPLRLDEARQLDVALDPIDAGRRVIVDAPDPATPASGDGIIAWLGPLAGLLGGLLLAALRELGGDRMRSPRQAERALGVPVLGAIPTLSAKARSACFEPPASARDAAATVLA